MDKLFFLNNNKIMNFILFFCSFVVGLICVCIAIINIGGDELHEFRNALNGTQFPIFTVLLLLILIMMLLMYISYWVVARILYHLSKNVLKFVIDFGAFHNIILIYSIFYTVGSFVNLFYIDKINFLILIFINPVFIFGYCFIYFISKNVLKLANKKSYIMTLMFIIFNSLSIIL